MAVSQQRSMQDLLVMDLNDLWCAEKKGGQVLEKMAQKATNPELKSLFKEHQKQTADQSERLTKIFEILKLTSENKPCPGMEGLVAEAEALLKQNMPPELLDAALIVAGQKIEHYEIACYGTVCAYAKALGQKEIESFLDQTLQEEKEADRKLSALALTRINIDALSLKAA